MSAQARHLHPMQSKPREQRLLEGNGRKGMTKRGLVWLALGTLGLPLATDGGPLPVPDPVGRKPPPNGSALRARRTHRRGAAAATANERRTNACGSRHREIH